MSGACRPVRRVVAQGSFCTVEECACGVLHVSLGVLTLRLQSEVVTSIWETLGEAVACLAAAHTRLENDGRARGSEQPS